MSLVGDSHKINPGQVVYLYVLNLNPIGVPLVHHFYPGTGANSLPIQYLGQTYVPWPIEMSGFEKRGSGSDARPKAIISNYMGAISGELKLPGYDDLVGASLTRRVTLSQYIDSNTAEYLDETYRIEQKVTESYLSVEFEMTSAMDFASKRLPGRIAVANTCPFMYGPTAILQGNTGSGCSWQNTFGVNATRLFDYDDNPVANHSQDICSKKLTGCKARFGATSELDFGGFPSLGRNG